MREKTVPARCARKFEVKRKDREKTLWRGQRESLKGEDRRNGRLVGATEISEKLAE